MAGASEEPLGVIGDALHAALSHVLDPELDEPILDLGFVRALHLRDGVAAVSLRLPTSWCAVNFAFIMAEDVRAALLAVPGVRSVTVDLGDHCAASEIAMAVNAGMPFAKAFAVQAGPGTGGLRATFLRKGFLMRQEKLLRVLRGAGFTTFCSGWGRIKSVLDQTTQSGRRNGSSRSLWHSRSRKTCARSIIAT